MWVFNFIKIQNSEFYVQYEWNYVMTSHLKLPCGNIVSTFWLRIAAIVNAADIRGTVSQPDSVQGSSLHDHLHHSTKFLIVDCGVYPSLYSNGHHQITYCKLNLSIEYPPLCEHLVWDYNKANVEGIKESIESVNWEVMFNNKSVHKQVSIFNATGIYFHYIVKSYSK